MAPTVIRIIKEIVGKFGTRRLNDIRPDEWRAWVAQRQAGNKAATRERFVSGVAAFQNFCVAHHKLKKPTKFERDKAARNPRRRARRRVADLRPDLIKQLFDAAHISLRAQLAAEWSTGARVSSILYGARICDVMLAPGRETITFRETKNGDDVAAALHPTAARILREYVDWRGGLHDREAPFFLTYKRKPYADNGRGGGGQNKTAFLAAKRRARRAILGRAFDEAKGLKRRGRREDALSVLLRARDDARLLRRLTQHWFRHLLATRMRHDLRAAMEQGGWRDERSILGYIHDVPEGRRAIVTAFEDIDAEPSVAKTAAKPA
ncbi:tyrosine-type recombinase/integrase [Methylocella silvestris]|uniref:tyrosine-type recombinase/integrase n=1 Tax=Methylocella silvestris TaxID=199596 RepID=UPI0015E12CA3|nr:tyrosine-type recombinase/integrase [Methylocella silvestris]